MSCRAFLGVEPITADCNKATRNILLAFAVFVPNMMESYYFMSLLNDYNSMVK